jgi:hypothetical protein
MRGLGVGVGVAIHELRLMQSGRLKDLTSMTSVNPVGYRQNLCNRTWDRRAYRIYLRGHQ